MYNRVIYYDNSQHYYSIFQKIALHRILLFLFFSDEVLASGAAAFVSSSIHLLNKNIIGVLLRLTVRTLYKVHKFMRRLQGL